MAQRLYGKSMLIIQKSFSFILVVYEKKSPSAEINVLAYNLLKSQRLSQFVIDTNLTHEE